MRMSDLESTVKAITASVPQSYEKGSIVLSSLSEFLRLQAQHLHGIQCDESIAPIVKSIRSRK